MAALIVLSFVLAFAPRFIDTTTIQIGVSVIGSVFWVAIAVYVIRSNAALGADERDEVARRLNTEHGVSLTSEDVRYLLSAKQPLRVTEGDTRYEFFYDGQTITVEQSPTRETV
ncbi:hypothetical protein [Aeromicrobium sp. 179-A 4D2 NHS]|uniref:hypothetical protein n=1 Tax=Aeromicrobium sp. 179-A 4D2 NHS TaxID=3142375 RepID=UPI00399F836F